MAHKKGQGSIKNGRDSNANVGRGNDDTLFALIEGFVTFKRKGKDRKKVCVYTERS